MKKLVDRDAARKVAMEASVTQVHLAEDAIKNGSVVKTVSGFGMVVAVAGKLHAGIRNLRLQTAKAVLGQMERLLTEIPVTADALFGGGLTNVIIQVAKRAKDWDRFVKAAGHAGLGKITAVSSRTEGQSSSRLPRKRGGSGFRRSDSTKRKDSSRCRKDQRSGSPPQKPFRGGRGGGWGGRGNSTGRGNSYLDHL